MPETKADSACIVNEKIVRIVTRKFRRFCLLLLASRLCDESFKVNIGEGKHLCIDTRSRLYELLSLAKLCTENRV